MNGEMTISISAENFKRFKELAGLNEKQSRLFFGLYSLNLGRGGPKKVAEHFGVGINTVRIGLSEFKGEESLRERQKFCVHGIIGARQTGASNEHEHQTQFS